MRRLFATETDWPRSELCETILLRIGNVSLQVRTSFQCWWTGFHPNFQWPRSPHDRRNTSPKLPDRVDKGALSGSWLMHTKTCVRGWAFSARWWPA